MTVKKGLPLSRLSVECLESDPWGDLHSESDFQSTHLQEIWVRIKHTIFVL